MKSIIQSYGLLLVFSFIIIMLPQVIRYAAVYNKLNMMSSRVVEIIEVSDGDSDYYLEEVSQYKSKYSNVDITIKKESIKEYTIYNVKVESQFEIALLKLKVSVKSSKQSKRIKGGT
ncbi:MAG: hypothetical protein ACK5KQ_05970 [Anaerorhabdus sp.]